jgi:hypothetical protein
MGPRRRPSREPASAYPRDGASSAAKSRTGFRLPTRCALVGGQVAQLCPGFRSTRAMRPRRRPSREPAFDYPHDGASSAAKSLNFAQTSGQPARWGLVGGQVAYRLPPSRTMGPRRRPSRAPASAYPRDGASSAAKSLNFAQTSGQPARCALVGGQVANRLSPTHTMGPRRRPSRSTLPRLPLNPHDAPSSAAKSRTGFRLPTRWGLVGGQVAQLRPDFWSTRTMGPRRRPSREPASAYPHDGASSAAKSLNFAQASAQPARWGLVGGQVAYRLPPTRTMGPRRRPSRSTLPRLPLNLHDAPSSATKSRTGFRLPTRRGLIGGQVAQLRPGFWSTRTMGLRRRPSREPASAYPRDGASSAAKSLNFAQASAQPARWGFVGGQVTRYRSSACRVMILNSYQTCPTHMTRPHRRPSRGRGRSQRMSGDEFSTSPRLLLNTQDAFLSTAKSCAAGPSDAKCCSSPRPLHNPHDETSVAVMLVWSVSPGHVQPHVPLAENSLLVCRHLCHALAGKITC